MLTTKDMEDALREYLNDIILIANLESAIPEEINTTSIYHLIFDLYQEVNGTEIPHRGESLVIMNQIKEALDIPKHALYGSYF